MRQQLSATEFEALSAAKASMGGWMAGERCDMSYNKANARVRGCDRLN
jgi:hypothetical protein